MTRVETETQEQAVHIRAGRVMLDGLLAVPEDAQGLVIFAHGSGSSRLSPRNRYVAKRLRDAHLGTFLFDLLTPLEEEEDLRTAGLRFDIPLLAGRVEVATKWLLAHPPARHVRIGYFGASTGAAAVLMAAARNPQEVAAIVSRGGRPDLADEALPAVRAPTLLIVGEHDTEVIRTNQEAMRRMQAPCELRIVPHAGHLFEEPGALAHVARLAREWFQKYLK